MTRDDQRGQKQHAEGDFPADAGGTDLTDKEIVELHAREGRGARQVPGAEPSDEYVQDHVEGSEDQGPSLLDPTTKDYKKPR